ncbi:SDR family NAD(P)-dependent oxidoreductase [Amycolatopsis sp. GM8]|uniref:SDR family NAD(P)-dependent oxidoreductase n=1 Tax=Amycolatopsis sp. GM8 TaxID=2896530 RepID=UPI001F2697D6|nr:SDR family NAD(P)-dependent oxidoreductase [Amycolatopsis sp. GM8]
MTTLVMTGASRGLGRQAAELMLRDDPELRLIVIARGETIDHPRVTTIRADLASLAEVRAAAARITEPVDGYVGNAGLQLPDSRGTTVDGYELTFGVNVLAHFALIRALTFKPGARIVITGSDAHFGTFQHTFGLVPAPRWTTPAVVARPADVKGRVAYSTSKLGVVYLVHELARRMPDAEVYTFNPAFTPGTGLVRADRLGNWLFRHVFTRFPGVNTAERAGTQLAAAVTGPRPAPSGAYIDREKVMSSSPESYSEERERELWSALESMAAPRPVAG